MWNTIPVLLGTILLSTSMLAADPGYIKQIEAFRAGRETLLKADDGWLTVTGLFWLKPGDNRIGTDAGNQIVLPKGSAPGLVGTYNLTGDAVTFTPAAGAAITQDGKPVTSKITLTSDRDSNKQSTLAINKLKLISIYRDRHAVRMKDNDSEIRRGFTGCRWYPANPEWRLDAKFVRQPGGAKITLETVVGNKESYDSAGFAVFTKNGKEYRLEAAKSGERLWFVFRDQTSGKTTYGGARQLYVDMPKGDTFVLDFNKVINFPCAFTPFTTCPLAPPQNRLALAVEAGELDYKH